MPAGIPPWNGHGFRARRPELAAVDRLLRDVPTGRGGALVVHGDAGIGKTALLERAVAAVPGLRPLRANGTGTAGLPYGALHELCEPVLARAETLPGPQRDALEVLFALRDGPPPEPSRLGHAVRGLLAAAGREQPTVCLLDDADALDPASARVLAFAARRARTAPVAFLVAVRADPAGTDFAGLPAHRLTGLGRDDALALFGSRLRVPLDPRVRDRLIAEARGNPRTLLELQRRAAEPAAGYGPPHLEAPRTPGRPVRPRNPGRTRHPRRLRQPRRPRRHRPSRRVRPPRWASRLDPAAAFAGRRGTAGRSRVGVGRGAAARDRARRGGARRGGRVAPPRRPRPLRAPAAALVGLPGGGAGRPPRVHRALADATDPGREPDRRAWHHAHPSSYRTDTVAAALERSMPRARERGGVGAAGAFLARAAALTP
ncbi:ATP-binding protein, partial [Actinomadura sp. CNU-125]|uniref:ATP-binding protein n=1 Tax=Actinomadura sp. CNU-125 TaxID=1904961 RepID=UPI001178526E